MTGSLLIMAACTLWAIDTLIRYPLGASGVSSTQIVFYEHLILALVLWAFWYRGNLRTCSIRRQHWLGLFCIGGIGSALGSLAFTQAFTLLNPTVVILLQKLQPVVAISLSAWLLKERIQGYFYLWALVCVLGSLMIMYEDIAQFIASQSPAHYDPSKPLLGYGLALLAVCAWGSATVFGKRLSNQGLAEKDIMLGRFVSGLLVLLPVGLMSVEATFVATPNTLAQIFAMAALSGLAGMYLYYAGLKRIQAHSAALAEMFFPVAAALINWLFLDKILTWIQIFGAVILVLGSLMVRRNQNA